MGHWNFTPKSSYGLQTVAALLKYELLEDEGSGLDRLVKINDLGLSILVPENEAERQKAIRTAALSPALISDVWNHFNGELPSDGTIKVYLIRQKGFNPRSVDDFIGVIRRTIDFSKPTYGNYESEPTSSGDSVEGFEPESNPTQLSFQSRASDAISQEIIPMTAPEESAGVSKGHAQVRVLHLPLLEGTWALLQAPFPMSENDWKQMQSVLEAMKPGLVMSGIQESNEDSVKTTEELGPLAS